MIRLSAPLCFVFALSGCLQVENVGNTNADSGIEPFDAGPVQPRPDAGVDAGVDAGQKDAGPDAGPVDAGPLTAFCQLSGSWVHDSSGMHVIGTDPAVGVKVDGGAVLTEVYPGKWLTIPEGFCAHHYATVPNARQLRFAPGGELFVASPTNGTTGGGGGGKAAIVVVPDDNSDGFGDSVLTFKSSLPDTQGILFANGYFYFQADQNAASADGGGNCSSAKGTAIYREPYVSGQRADNGQSQQVVNVTYYCDSLHWPKTLDIANDGTIYIGNGGSQGDVCEESDGGAASMPLRGSVVQMLAPPQTGSATCTGCEPIVKGLRNPIDVKCHHGFNACFSTELALDYSANQQGREKLLQINSGDDWGFPCCATKGMAYTGITIPCAGTPGMTCTPDCSTVAQEHDSFVIGNTPFGFDFDDTQFPPPWDHEVLVALHGTAGFWSGARVVAIAMDPISGIPLGGSDIDGGDTGAMTDFATGWDDATFQHGRPADIAFAADGRMFVANDTNGEIFWIAPITQ